MPRPRTAIGDHGRLAPKKVKGTWKVRAYVRDHDGHRVEITATGRTEAEAVANWHVKKAARVFSGGTDLKPTTTIEDAAKIWDRDYLTDADLAVGTKKRYREAITKVIVPLLGQVRLNELSPSRVARFLKDTPSSRKQARTVLSQICDLAIIEAAIMRNPVKDCPSFKRLASNGGAIALNKTRLTAIQAAITTWEGSTKNGRPRSIPLRDILLFQLCAGTRIGETLGLHWGEVNLADATVLIKYSVKEDEDGKQVLGDTKGGAARMIPLPDHCVTMLRRRLAEARQREDWDMNTEAHTPVFASRNGTCFWVNNVNRAWREARALGKVSIKDITPHDLRKTYGTRIIERFGLEAGSKMLGHSDTRTTEQFYWDKGLELPTVRPLVGDLGADW